MVGLRAHTFFILKHLDNYILYIVLFNVYRHYTLNLYNIKDVKLMVQFDKPELNAFEKAIELCKSQIKNWTAAHRSDLVQVWKQELDKWNTEYSKYLSTVSR